MKRMKELRESHHLNQEGLGLILHLSQSTISAYEAGIRIPDVETVKKMAEYFRVSIDYLVGLSDNKYCSESEFTRQEIDLIDAYRNLSKLNDINK